MRPGVALQREGCGRPVYVKRARMRLIMQLHQPTKRDQSGFSVIEVLLVVLVVAVLLVTGLVVYQHHKQSAAKNSAATSTNQTTTQPKSTTTTQPAQTTTQYSYINEWGIKAKLNATFTLRYKIWPSNPNIADFTSDQLTAASSSPGCGIGLTPDGMPYNHGGGSIRRLKGNDLLYAPEIATYTAEQFATDPKYAASRADITKVGDYYYFYYHEQGPCADTGFTQEQTENAVRYLLQSFQPE